jgi:hypothetical protein
VDQRKYLLFCEYQKHALKNKTLLSIIALLLSLSLQDCVRPPYHANLMTGLCNAPISTCDWMSTMISAHPDVALTDICLPASHDAAMYMTQHCTPFANVGNTQTQYLPLKQQLEAGVRLFDLRPWVLDGEFYGHHSTHCDGLGCKGDKLINMLTATRNFVDKHHELVILMFTHYCHTSAKDTAFLSLLTGTLGDLIYRETSPSDMPIIGTPLRKILGEGKEGKVLLLLEAAENSPANHAIGFFNTDVLKTFGGWSNDNEYELLREHQLQRFAAYQGNGPALFELAWQITQHDPQAVHSAFAPYSRIAIRNGAYHANLHLPVLLDSLIKVGAIHKGKIPNIIWSDCVDTMVTHQCMKLSAISAGN